MSLPAPWRACLLTLFPDMFPGPLGLSLAGKALKDEKWAIETLDIREFSSHKHRAVDDTPYGGGAGLVLMPDVIDAALVAAKSRFPEGRVVYLTPRGPLLTQKMVEDFATSAGLIVLCGRYEGVDQRVLEAHNATEVSVGDYVLSGGEPAALVLLDACVRLLPSVMGNEETTDEESFSDGLLEYPHYTRPASWQGRDVPDVLLSGHHGQVAKWRKEQSELVTRERRPDLWQAYQARQELLGTVRRPKKKD